MTPPARCCASSARAKPPGRRPICCVPGSYGVPRALYTDWKNVYVRLPNVQERLRGEAAVTQFGQMCAKLGIRIIAASSPQAKGRVERVPGTHQDRLVKKLRLATVSNYDDANAYLQDHYIAQHTRHYARPAAAEADYH